MKFNTIMSRLKKMPIWNKCGTAWKKVAVWFRTFFGNISTNRYVKKVFSPLGLRILIYLFVLVGVIQIVFAVSIYGFKSDDKVTRWVAKVVPFPAEVVNYDVVTYEDYFSEKDYIHHFYQSTGQESVDIKSIDAEILNQLVENKIIAYQASANGVHVSNQEIQDSLDSIIQQNGGKDQVEKVLNDLYGLSFDQFRALVKSQMLRDAVNQKLIMKVTASHILVRVAEDAPADKVEEARVKIAGIKTEIDNGLDFAEAAKKYSEDTGSAENGGLLEPFSSGEMVAEFSQAAFSAEIGKVTDPVRTSFGWHLIKVESRTGKIQKSFTDWLTEKKDKSLILNFVRS